MIPVAPSGITLIIEGMKRALGRTPSSGEQVRALDTWFSEIKSDIWFDDGGSHAILQTDTLMLLTEGTHIYSLPSDFDTGKSFNILDGDVRDTAQAGTLTTITLAATDSSESAGRIGKEIVTLSGTGSGQKRQITGFNTVTKIATVDSAWSTIPNSSTTYMLVTEYHPLSIVDAKTFNQVVSRTERERPDTGIIWNSKLYLQLVPDKTYPLWCQYWANILQVDTSDSNTTHQNMLNMWRSLFTQGFFVKTLQNEDDDRFMPQLAIYHDMITKITYRSQMMGRVEPHDY